MPRPSRFQLRPLNLGKDSLGDRLARIRKERGYTQVELAQKIGIIQALISDYERGRIRPNLDIIVRLALALDVSTDELLGLKTAKPQATIRNRRILRRLKKIDELSKHDQDTLIRTLDVFLQKVS